MNFFAILAHELLIQKASDIKEQKMLKEVIIMKRFMKPRVAHCSEGCMLVS
jgi:hypothetical protein